MSDLIAFREEARSWLEENCPASMRVPDTTADEYWGGSRGEFPSDDARLWFERMVERGWTAPTWPRRYGGGGLSEAEGRILDEELRRLKCRPPLRSLGIWLLAPALLEYGTEEQKLEHLPPMARGETRWCQGYSEPGAGSDLASLQMSAELDGDAYVVNGQKIWTSHANLADWMFCLVRTDPNAPKREGIGFLLVDMTTPGLTVRPIELISGASHFCEAFLEDVRVPAANLIGAPNQGWEVAKAVLRHERTVISKLRDAAVSREEPLEEIARRYLGTDAEGLIADRALRDRLIQVRLDTLCNELSLRRSAEAVRAGLGPGPESSTFKLYASELNQRRRELKVLIEGFRGLGWEGPGFSEAELGHTRDWLRSRASTIEGGTTEIQLNIIAKRVLGLPD